MPISILHPQRHGPRRAMPLSLSKRIFAKLSNETCFTGLSFEKAAARCSARRARRTLRTFTSRAVFSLRLRAQTLRGFFECGMFSNFLSNSFLHFLDTIRKS